jgi:hypothetical protein
MTVGSEVEAMGGMVRVTANVARGGDETWQCVGGFTDSGKFSDVRSVLESGGGGLGSIRRVDDAVVEKMVAQGRHFYVYVQIEGAMAHLGYHGCLAVEEVGADHSLIVYTLVYDEEGLDPARRESERGRLTRRFQDRLQAMSEYVALSSEAPPITQR